MVLYILVSQCSIWSPGKISNTLSNFMYSGATSGSTDVIPNTSSVLSLSLKSNLLIFPNIFDKWF